MPRFPRNHIKTTFFHAITQGIDKSYIFQNSEDIKYYIKSIYNISKEQNIKIIAYCIMNNHAHILIQTQNISELSKYMQRLNTKYGRYYNTKYGRVGYVFKDRYKSEGIYSQKHLYNCIRYIHNNPVKAGICTKPDEYPYSNYKKIENDNIEEDYQFLDIDEDEMKKCTNLITDFLIKNNIEKTDLKTNTKILRELLMILKGKHNISLRKIAEKLNLNRETIRKLYKS